uniref:SMC hinge domain-containing protein n=1 Tax=Esox lucius TaxID=8010 RepID=A0A6Q2XGE5_ESOLU
MHIKSIILEGFKSYAQRTEINGFDPLFNAITGLNGSGKSNILDSICFLLGISNLSQVRAANLQDLVYKNGQAGITKATVSITFDNSNKSQSPLGFETHDEITVTRQVVIGGRNKYLINGVNANNTRVQDLFCSVGLNVNNPHFLIMQGRITKVLNMKPPEILAMIEEAAGTRMYECKKISAQKTIEKKEAKLKEIQTILNEEITPTMEKLKEERSSYLEYQKLMREIEHLSRLYVAWLFVCAEETKVRSAEDLKVLQDSITQLQASMSENERKVQELSAEIHELQKKRDQEVSGVLKGLEEALSEVQRVDAKAQSALDLKKQNLKDETKKRKELVKSMEEDKKMLVVKEAEVSKVAEKLCVLQDEGRQDNADLEAAQCHFKAVSAGLSTNEDGEEATLAGQMMTCKNDMSKADTEAKQAQMKLKHAQAELKAKQTEVKKMDSGYKKDQEAFNAVKKNKEKLEAELEKLQYQDGKEESLLDRKRQSNREVTALRNAYEGLMARFPNLRFDYRDPERGWDRSRVKGLLANLITVSDVSYSTSLEVVAGGRLYNVVVDTEVTGKKLLEKGELKRRYTIIPLNKISARTLNDNVVGENNVHTALSLVGYEADLRKAMEYVFGSTLVCDTLDNAKQVAFDRRVMTKTVTLGGDVFDPQGTLTGGARSQSASVLSSLQELREAQENLSAREAELQAVDKELASVKGTAERYRVLKQQLDMKTEELEILQTKLQQSSFHKQQEEQEMLRRTIEECEETLRSSKEVQKKAEEKYKVLENKMKNAEAEREKELKAAQQNLNSAKAKADAFSKKLKERQQEAESLALELEELKREQSGYEQQIQAVDEAMKAVQEQIDNMSTAVAQNKEAVRKAQEELSKQKEGIVAQDKEIKAKSSEANRMREKTNESQLRIKELEHNISKHRKDSQDAAAKVYLADH